MFTAQGVLDTEVAAIKNFFGINAAENQLCTVSVQQNNPVLNSFDSVAAVMFRVEDITAVVRVSIQIISIGGGANVNFMVVQMVAGPTAEFLDLINDIFIPMVTQFYGGGSSDFACSDRLDNDGDGQVDYPQDTGCTSEVDDSES